MKRDSPFVTVSRTNLVRNRNLFTIHSATTYGRLDNPDGIIALAQEAKLNTLEVVEFEMWYRDPNSLQSEETWTRVDRLIAKCRTARLGVLLHFSSYGHTLASQGMKPTTQDWGPYLSWVMSRVNTVNGLRYRDDPTIVKIHLYGEIAAPNGGDPMRGTTAETTQFFARTLGQLRTLAPNHVISSGGFSYIDNPDSGIDWQTIMADPNNQTCDVEENSWPDHNISVPAVAEFARDRKPWMLTAFSAGLGQPEGDWDINHYPDDSGMAAHFDDCYRRARGLVAPIQVSCGASFWNLGDVPAGTGVTDIGHQYPLTFNTVIAWAPN